MDVWDKANKREGGKQNMPLNLKPIGEHSYSWAEGFALAGLKRKDGSRQLDWDTIRILVDSGEYSDVEVGLAEDYYQTHAVIVEDGEKVIIENDGSGFYGASRWATPAVKLTKNGETGLFECWVAGDNHKFPDWIKETHRRID